MNFIICGLPGSGKSTVAKLIREVSPDVSVMDLLEIECALDALVMQLKIESKSQVIVVDTPAILCYSRSGVREFEEFARVRKLEQKEKHLKYMTELPGITIIKNDLTIDHLRVNIKKYLKKA